MKTASKRFDGFDLIRSLVILGVLIHHIITKEPFGGTVKSISAGLGLIGMSLLGFMSGALISNKNYDYGILLLRRLSRIYIPLWLCLSTVLFLYSMVGQIRITQHTLLHYMGLTMFFQLFGVISEINFSGGLWFVTTIIILYLATPLFGILFTHRNRTIHLLICCTAFSTLDFIMYNHANFFNVATGFAVGLYLQKTGKFETVLKMKPVIYLPAALILIVINVLSVYEAFPIYVHSCFYLFYPFIFIPLFFKISTYIPTTVMKTITMFAAVSYEFYILHFYFINDKIYGSIISPNGIASKIIVSFSITLAFSVVLAWIGYVLRKSMDAYLFGKITPALADEHAQLSCVKSI